MLFFFASLGLLILGFFVYGSVVERLFGADPARTTPVCTMADGVDYIPMPIWKLYLIQLLNIAGLGPVFGPILGALYGPAALLWVVLGTIFGGAVHDYFSGMLSIRSNGASVPEVVGQELGYGFKQFMRAFSILLLLLVGVVFVLGPAKLLENLTGMSTVTWVVIIFCYYFLATILPINQIIGRIYPFFGAVLLFMAVGLTAGLLTEGYDILPTLDFSNLHPKGLPLWPLMFITIACGAISGFHSTQSPMMARCMANERHGRTVFYGAMVGEGIIGLIWVTLGLSFYKGPEALSAALAAGGPAHVVNEVATTLLGGFGGILAIIGVVILPITTGDTAFRSARLIVADFMHISQSKAARRLAIAIPLFVIGIVVSRVDFNVLWRYFGWANQTLAALVLWAAAAWMIKRGKMHWIVTLPATFMTTVVSTYILYEKIGFNLPITVANYGGIACGLVAFAIFMAYFRNRRVADAPTA